MFADDLLEDARHLAAKGDAEKRASCMRRAVSTAYYYIEAALVDVKTAFRELQADRHRADYDLAWNIVPTDVADVINLAEDTFSKWRSIRNDDTARHHLLSMFGANR